MWCVCVCVCVLGLIFPKPLDQNVVQSVKTWDINYAVSDQTRSEGPLWFFQCHSSSQVPSSPSSLLLTEVAIYGLFAGELPISDKNKQPAFIANAGGLLLQQLKAALRRELAFLRLCARMEKWQARHKERTNTKCSASRRLPRFRLSALVWQKSLLL